MNALAAPLSVVTSIIATGVSSQSAHSSAPQKSVCRMCLATIPFSIAYGNVIGERLGQFHLMWCLNKSHFGGIISE